MMDNIIDGVSPHVNTSSSTKYDRRVYADQWRWRMLEESNLPPLAKFVALVVSLHDGLGEPRPTHKRIAMLTGLDERTVKGHLRRSCLWLPVIEPGKHRGQAAVYGLEIPGKTLDELAAILERGTTGVPLYGERGTTESPPTGAPLSEKAPQPMPPFHGERGTTGAPPVSLTKKKKEVVCASQASHATVAIFEEPQPQTSKDGKREPREPLNSSPPHLEPKASDTNNPPPVARAPLPSKRRMTREKMAERRDLVTKLRVAAGAVMAGTVYHIDKVETWIADGCDLELDIIPTIERVGASALRGKGPGVLTTWAYFSAPVHEARDRRLAGAPAPQPRINGYRREDGLPKGYRIAD